MWITATHTHLWGMISRITPRPRLAALFRHFPTVDRFWETYPQKMNVFFVLLVHLLYFGILNNYPPYMGVLFSALTDLFSNKWSYCPQAGAVLHSF